jgi:hypothetical protein
VVEVDPNPVAQTDGGTVVGERVVEGAVDRGDLGDDADRALGH